MRCNLFRVLASVGILAAASFGSANAATLSYTLDSSQSYLTIAVFTPNPDDPEDLVPITLPQTAGSDTTSLYGSILADTSGGSVTFSTQSNLNFNYNGLQFPASDGGTDSAGAPFNGNPSPPDTGLPPNPGVGAAQYGLTFIVPADLGDPLDVYAAGILGYAAISNALGDLTGSGAYNGLTTFDASTLSLTIVNGDLAYNLNLGDGTPLGPSGAGLLPPGTASIGGSGAVNSLAGNGSVVVGGGYETITVPFYVRVDLVLDPSIPPIAAIFTGQIVASTPVPEPSTIALAGMGLIALVPVVRRRLRKA